MKEIKKEKEEHKKQKLKHLRIKYRCCRKLKKLRLNMQKKQQQDTLMS